MQNMGAATKFTNSAMAKLLVIGVLVTVLLIPLEMVKGIIAERSLRKQGAVEEVSRKWGAEQFIAGPILSIPYKAHVRNEKGVDTVSIHHAHFLPEELSVNGIVKPDIRYRGIYEIVLYSSELQITANFGKIRFRELGIEERDMLWDRAFVSVGIPDLKGMKKNNIMAWNKVDYPLNPGIEGTAFMESGIGARIPVTGAQDQYTFQMNLNLNGSGQLNFLPLGKITTVHLSSSWKNPSFTGSFLPDERVVGEKGFDAKWKILHLNRNYPQQWIGKHAGLTESVFGVKLFYPIDEYQKTERSVKYAVLFIMLTFISFFLTEVINRKRLHPIQYLLVGFAICLFYVLLLSISEHTSFWLAYLLSSVASILLVALYTKGILKSLPMAATVGGLLTFLYGFLYVTLQMEDYALLLGSIGLGFVLAVVMYLTRKIDWYTFSTVKTVDKSGGEEKIC